MNEKKIIEHLLVFKCTQTVNNCVRCHFQFLKNTINIEFDLNSFNIWQVPVNYHFRNGLISDNTKGNEFGSLCHFLGLPTTLSDLFSQDTVPASLIDK